MKDSPLTALRLSSGGEKSVPRQNHHVPRKFYPKQEESVVAASDSFLPESLLVRANYTPKQADHDEDVLPEKPIDKTHVKKVKELAAIFLDTRKSLRADRNVVEAGKSSELAGELSGVSQKTLLRAERVKLMISIKYLYLQRIIENIEGEHPAIENVYNPLQVLRNRKIRAMYREKMRPMSMRELPLASNVFSKHNVGSRKKPWKMEWALELSEYLGDVSWRRQHWNELRKADGLLWFPLASSEDDKKQRIHDNLFDDGASSKRKSLVSSHLSSKSSEGEFFKSARKQLTISIKTKIKRNLYNNSSSSGIEIEEADDDRDRGSNELLKNTLFKRVTLSTDDILDDLEDSNLIKEYAGHTEAPPQLEITPPFDINTVDIKPTKKDVEVVEVEDVAEEVTDEDQGCAVVQCDLMTQELLLINADFVYFEQIITSRMNYMLQVYPHITGATENKIRDIVQRQLHDIFQLTMNISDFQLPAYELLYGGFLNEVKAIIHMVNDEYSIKIDNLLSQSDRCIGEINTSLSLEMRKVNEKLEKLNSSLFNKSVMAQKLRGEELTMDIRNSNSYKYLYLFLENLIVVMLRFIWVIVNIYKAFTQVLKMIWSIIRTLLF